MQNPDGQVTIRTSDIPPRLPPGDHLDEINILEYVYVVVRAKWWILLAAIVGFALGKIFVMVKGPDYVATVVIASRETDSQRRSPNLSNLGMLGGIVASQLSVNSPGLDKIYQVLRGKQFHADLAEKYGLVPLFWPERWDSKRNTWAAGTRIPKPLAVGAYLRGNFIEFERAEDNTTLSVKFRTKDSTFTDTLVTSFLTYLDTYIKSNVREEAEQNRIYLERQLRGVEDPLLRSKMQELIAGEVEKLMVVSSRAFTIVDPPLRGATLGKKGYAPLVLAIGLAFLVAFLQVFMQALRALNSRPVDAELAREIFRESIRLPGRGRKQG